MSKVRGRDYCRACGGNSLFSALNLGFQPIANELVLKPSIKSEVFELHLRICSDCKLGQIQDVVAPDRLFEDYRYLSSVSISFNAHAMKFVSKCINEIDFKAGEWVLEIASNDGYLLKHFLKAGIQVLGIEPSVNVSAISRKLSIPTITEFFGKDTARSILEKYGTPRLIIANNVLAHVPDINDFLDGIELLTGEQTIVSIENPSLLNILQENQFDSIYHEHYSYLSAHAIEKLLFGRGISLKSIEKIETHGGSLRYTICKQSKTEKRNAMTDIIFEAELHAKLFDEEEWIAFNSRVEKLGNDFRNLLIELQQEGKKVWGFGAAAKCCTLISFAGVKQDLVLGIADSSSEKQGRFIPNSGIQIFSPEEMKKEHPDSVIIFAWNVFDEIASVIRKLSGQGVEIWRIIPKIERFE